MKLITNHYGIELTGQLCVASVGRDENLRLWDGLLGSDWVGECFLSSCCDIVGDSDKELAHMINFSER